jgi:hypothetical protein
MPGKISIPSQELAALLGVESVAPGGNLKDRTGSGGPSPCCRKLGPFIVAGAQLNGPGTRERAEIAGTAL